ncbi:MAG TPA: hypothetical protein VGQ24_12560 [Gemmatimonadales bacterium]|nr:hypothetical protein [Gemmatimonadales bacterium]
MRHATRSSAIIARRFAVAGSIGVALWLGAVAPATAQLSTSPGQECDNVPLCQVQPRGSFLLAGWGTVDYDYTCLGDHPYVWNFSYSQTGSPSVSALAAIFAVTPGTIGILMTNWNLFATDQVTINLACSKNNSFGGICGGPVDDPACPVVAGSEHNYCSGGPVPVCFQTYQERCQPSNQLYTCTTILLVTYCQACPG